MAGGATTSVTNPTAGDRREADRTTIIPTTSNGTTIISNASNGTTRAGERQKPQQLAEWPAGSMVDPVGYSPFRLRGRVRGVRGGWCGGGRGVRRSTRRRGG